MIRWKGFIFIGVVLAVVIGITLIFKDSWLENRIENAGSSTVGAKVEIDNLDFSLTGLHIRWDRLQVTDPNNTMQNLFETGFTEFNMETWPLLSGKVIIDNLELSGFQTNTEREEDGALPEPSHQDGPSEPGFVDRTLSRLSNQVSSNVSTNISGFTQQLNVDSLMEMVDIRSIEKIDSLQSSLVQQYNQWDDRLSNFDYQDDLRQIESNLRQLTAQQLQSVSGIRNAITTVTETQDRIEGIIDDIESTRDDLVSDLQAAQTDLNAIDNWITEDYQRAQSIARLPDIAAGNISRFLFGDKVVNQFTRYTGYVGTARSYLGRLKANNEPTKERPPRMEGQDIHFFTRNARPRFWIKRISLSGVTGNQLPLAGEVNNIVSDQRLIGETTNIRVESLPESGTSFTLDGTLDYMNDTPRESFNLSYAGFSLVNNRLSNSSLLPNEIQAGNGTLEATLDMGANSLYSTIRFDSRNLRFGMSEANTGNQMTQIIQSIIAEVSALDLTAQIVADSSDLNFSLNSNLDDVLQDNLRSTVLREIERARNEVRSRVDAEVEKYRRQLESVIEERETELRAQINEYSQYADEVRELADEKIAVLREQLEQQIEDEGLDRLRNLLE